MNAAQLWPLFGLTLCLQVIGHNLLAQPAIASAYSFVVFSEVISMKEIFGIIIVLGGVYLVKMQYGSGA